MRDHLLRIATDSDSRSRLTPNFGRAISTRKRVDFEYVILRLRKVAGYANNGILHSWSQTPFNRSEIEDFFFFNFIVFSISVLWLNIFIHRIKVSFLDVRSLFRSKSERVFQGDRT